MFKKLTTVGILFTALTMLIPNTGQATVYYYPKGYYYRAGRWYPYRGHGHPYRGGYYDRWGRWHRYRY